MLSCIHSPRNPTAQPRRRTLLNFFIIDPSRPLPTSAEVVTRDVVVHALDAKFVELFDVACPVTVLHVVCFYE